MRACANSLLIQQHSTGQWTALRTTAHNCSVNALVTLSLAQVAVADSCDSKEPNPQEKADAANFCIQGLANWNAELGQRSLAACKAAQMVHFYTFLHKHCCLVPVLVISALLVFVHPSQFW